MHKPFPLLQNAAWCWYQDERALYDPERNELVFGSVACRTPAEGAEREGNVEVTFVRPEGTERHVLHAGLLSYGGADDHNAPALWRRPDGGIVALYAGHNNDFLTYGRMYRNGSWGPEFTFDWRERPGGCDFPTTYSNLHYLAAEKRLYNIARTHESSPNLMISENAGESWRYGGQLTRSRENIGYVNGYFRYASNGVERIDFLATEHHPRDFNNSLYHGFVRGGASHRNDGTVVAKDLMDLDCVPSVDQFTPVFKADSEVNGERMTHAWNLDFQAYPDGSLAALFQTRVNESDQDHRFFHARCEDGDWRWEQIAPAGAKIIPHEEDYTGGGCLDRQDPNRVFISTPIDPRDRRELGMHELFQGTRSSKGWEWEPITRNSREGNYRPLVPAGSSADRHLLWCRGVYRASQDYEMSVVGMGKGL